MFVNIANLRVEILLGEIPNCVDSFWNDYILHVKICQTMENVGPSIILTYK